MKKILAGFSLVEMMLLLLVTSLMLASAVTVVTKKHVKVPKITMHGAYMCYMKNGQLHEEQYVGSNLRKKTLDRDVAACSFTPPERASYLHIQAIGGGGGGGDSGYTGGNLQRFESATEVMSPFGITADILALKGISTAELQSLGGTVYAYAMAEGSGKGGNLYYIKQVCKNTCVQWRTWEYTGTQEVNCSCTKRAQAYTVYKKNYDLWNNCANSCYVPCTHTCYDSCPKTCWNRCSRQVKVDCDYREGSCSTCYEIEYGKGWQYNCKNNAGWKTVTEYYDCNPYTCYYDCNPHKCHSQDWVTSAAQCGTHVCDRITGSCETYTKPTSSYTDTYSNLIVKADDRYTEDWNKTPPEHMYEKTPASGTAVKETRMLRVDEKTDRSVCNYGNPAKFKGLDGVFGTFMNGEIPGLGCDTASIMTAFGDDIFPMGGGNTVITRLADKSSTAVYGGEGLKYDTSETNTNAYGARCINDAQNGDCNKYTYKYNVPNVTKRLETGYNVTYGNSSYNGCPNSNNYQSGSMPSAGSYQASEQVYGNASPYCSCPRVNSKGTECMLYKNACSYIPEVVNGGNANAGTSCRTNPISAGLGLTYVGNSSVIPGIRGSDINCTGAGYKATYTEAQWRAQPSCYAENGTDAVGSSTVSITGPGTASCTANAVAPTQGKGARKTSTGATTPTVGANSNRAATTILNNATNGAGCGSQHVGYCLKGNENAKYSYRYTWNTNHLQFGEGGKAGEYRAMVIRSFGTRPIAMTIGQGGAGGADETGDSGTNGGTTLVGDIVRAEGGAGGPGGLMTPTEQLPTWYRGGTFEKGWNGTQGESANVANFKANILNLVLPIDNSVLGQWLAASGAGGDGGGSRNNCWASEWVRWFEGVEVIGNGRVHPEDITCRVGKYWSATPNATAGAPGAVLIKW